MQDECLRTDHWNEMVSKRSHQRDFDEFGMEKKVLNSMKRESVGKKEAVGKEESEVKRRKEKRSVNARAHVGLL